MAALHAIDRESPLPLYAQVKRRLRAAIMAWPAGNDRFHTERVLCATFGVSRATVRQAMAELESEGLLRRRQGFGTLVNRPKIEESFTPLTNFRDQWASSGRELKVELHRAERIVCPAPFAEMLGLAAGEPVLHLERFRLAEGVRVAWDSRFIPKTVAAGIDRREFAKVSLLDVLARNVEFDRGESQLESALAGDEHAERLEMLSSDPVLMRHLIYFSTEDRPVLAGLSVYRADQVRYKVSAPMRSRGAGPDTELGAIGLLV